MKSKWRRNLVRIIKEYGVPKAERDAVYDEINGYMLALKTYKKDGYFDGLDLFPEPIDYFFSALTERIFYAYQAGGYDNNASRYHNLTPEKKELWRERSRERMRKMRARKLQVCKNCGHPRGSHKQKFGVWRCDLCNCERYMS